MWRFKSSENAFRFFYWKHTILLTNESWKQFEIDKTKMLPHYKIPLNWHCVWHTFTCGTNFYLCRYDYHFVILSEKLSRKNIWNPWPNKAIAHFPQRFQTAIFDIQINLHYFLGSHSIFYYANGKIEGLVIFNTYISDLRSS